MGQINWTIPKLWPDSTVFIIGGGPSVSDMDLSLLHDQWVIGVNSAFELGDWVDICFFGDARWFTWNREALSKFGGLKLCCCDRKFKDNKCWPGIHHIKRIGSGGLTTKLNRIIWNRNSGASAINLAYHLGAVKVVLIGFDMQMIEGEHNYHDSHKRHHTPPDNIYNRFLPLFKPIARHAKEMGLEIVNASPNSMITEFEKVNLKDVI